MVAQLVFGWMAARAMLDMVATLVVSLLIYLLTLVWIVVFWPSLTIEGFLAVVLAGQAALFNSIRLMAG